MDSPATQVGAHFGPFWHFSAISPSKITKFSPARAFSTRPQHQIFLDRGAEKMAIHECARLAQFRRSTNVRVQTPWFQVLFLKNTKILGDSHFKRALSADWFLEWKRKNDGHL